MRADHGPGVLFRPGDLLYLLQHLDFAVGTPGPSCWQAEARGISEPSSSNTSNQKPILHRDIPTTNAQNNHSN
ncbi:hypothetical protein Tco_0527177 [Tanacetum coccineum]